MAPGCAAFADALRLRLAFFRFEAGCEYRRPARQGTREFPVETRAACGVLEDGASPVSTAGVSAALITLRDYCRVRNISCAGACAFRKFQWTFHDGGIAAGAGVSA